MNFLTEMFVGAFEILFPPKPAKRYNFRDYKGRYAKVSFTLTFIGDDKPKGKKIRHQDDERIVFYE